MHGTTHSTASSAAVVGVGAVVSALSGFLIITLSARFLTTTENSGFMTFWAALFFVFGVLTGIQNEVTRAVRVELRQSSQVGVTSPLVAALGFGAVVSVGVVGLTPVLLRAFRTLDTPSLAIILMAGATVLFSGHLATVGALSGFGRWRGVAALTGGEAVVRLLLTVCAAVTVSGVAGFEMAAVGATLTWVVFAASSRRVRKALHLKVSLAYRSLTARVGQAMAASAANALLVTGFPLLMSVTSDPGVYANAAPLLVAVSVTRAPLLMPIGAFQSMIITWFVDNDSSTERNLLPRLVLAITATGVLGALAAAAVGPTLMQFIFGAAYRSSPWILAALVIDAAMLALLVLGGAIALALDLHSLNTLGWYVAVVVAVAVMMLPVSLESRTIGALFLGPVVGSVVHLGGVSRARLSR